MQKFFLKHKRLICVLAPALIGALYIILCAVNLQQSIWFDESYGAYLTRFGFDDIWNMTAVDVHPPLYYFLLKIWAGIFGFTDFGMRFMSVFFGAIAILFAWLWLKRKYGFKPAIFAALLMALSPMLVRYGQEMRMYALAAAIIFAATYVLQLAMDTKKRRFWVIYGVLISLGMWTHYFVALVWLAHLAYLIWTYRKKVFQKNIIIAYVVAVILYLPWMPSFIAQSSTVQRGFWIPEASVSSVTDYFTNSFIYLDSSEITGWLLMLTLVVVVIFTIVTVRAKKQLTLLNFMAFLPPILLILLSIPPFKPMFVDRYIVYSSVSMSLIAGVGVMLLSGEKRKKTKKKTLMRFAPVVFALVFLGTSVVGIYNVYSLGNYNKMTDGKSDAKALFEAVSAASAVGEPIITQTEWLYYDLSFYGNDEHPVYFLDETTSYEWGSHEPLKTQDYGKIIDLDAFLEEHDRVWYVGDLPKTGSIEFVREEWQAVTELVLPVNENQSDYQALEFQNPKIMVQ
ncbi:MAG: glycosyltransferase family 39 protein [Candidatus Saccharimonadales bacterium]